MNNLYLINHFIRGFFDGDGGISINQKTNGVCFHLIGTEKVLLRIRDYIVDETFVKKVGLFPKKNVKNIFVLEWSGIHQLEAIRKFLYKRSEVCLGRKYDRFCFIKNRSEHFMKNRKSKFRGISKSGDKFMASIYDNKKTHYLGTYEDEASAAAAYDKAVIKFKKPKYRLNFPIGK